jgi:hypothetical protein
MALYADRLSVCGKEFTITEIKDMAVQGIRRMNLYAEDGTYSVDVRPRTNLLKYMICAYHLKNIAQENKEEFYGY